MPIYHGSQKLADLYVGGQKIGEGWIWNGSQWVQVYSAVPRWWTARDEFDLPDTPQLSSPWVMTSSNTTGCQVGISNGKAIYTQTSPAFAARLRYIHSTSIGSRQRVEVILGSNVGGGLALRSGIEVDSACVLLSVNVNRNPIVLYQAAGTANPTTVATLTSTTATAGDLLAAEADGTTLRVYLNNTLITTRTDVTATGTYCGLRLAASGMVESWAAGALP